MNIPASVLAGSDKAKLRFFSRQLPQHAAFQRAFFDLKFSIDSIDDAPIVLLIGPTGVGKTRLIEAYTGAVREKYANPAAPHQVSAVLLEAEEAKPGEFDWSYLYSRCLSRLGEPSVECTLPVMRSAGSPQNSLILDYRRRLSRPSPSDLMRRLKSVLALRKTRILCIDEAYHILQAGDRAAHVIRSLASMDLDDEYVTDIRHVTEDSYEVEDRVDTRIILVGSYELFKIASASPELMRRCEIVHFSPYPATEKGKEKLKEALQSLQDSLPLERRPDLLQYLDELHLASCGCIGLLKKILTRALALALKTKEKIITEKILRRCYLRKSEHEKFIADIKVGAELLSDSGFVKAKGAEGDSVQSESGSSGDNRRPGERSPHRDRVVI